MKHSILECSTYSLGNAPTPIKFTVLFTRFRKQWLFVRHKARDTWECAGGHIDADETPFQGARRELYEEAGVADAEIVELFDYWARDDEGNSSGRVFLAFARTLEEIPEEFEMAERLLSENLPKELTYPLIYQTLFPLIEAECEKREAIAQ